MEAKHWETKKSNQITCLLCPNSCTVPDGGYGVCKVRSNKNGVLTLPHYGKVSSVFVDPIEKKPLYHYFPGSSILSVGFVGCSLSCPFCQNHSISQTTNANTTKYDPEEIVSLAKEKKSLGIAYTYSEPTIHFEYVTAVASLARQEGLKNVLVSNGYLNPGPAEELLSLMDAANIDLKSFNTVFYKKELKGKLKPVKDFIIKAALKTSLEVTTLVIPGKNDSLDEIEEIARFIASINPSIPLHLSRYYPTFKYTIPPTAVSSLKKLEETALKHLNYVYLGNVGLREINTYCNVCRSLLVRRVGYSVETPGFVNGACSSCGTKTPIVDA